MPTVTHHVPGTFCWPELATPDAKSSQRFYSELFGWTAREFPMEMGAYYIQQLGGRDVAAMYELSASRGGAGQGAHWAAYVAVASADETARLASQSGGRVIMGPFDVLDVGRMAVIEDAVGATLCLWQPIRRIGVGVLGEPGALGWTQLNTREPARAKAFYTAAMGWSFRDDPMGPDTAYTTWLKADGAAGGMMPMPMDMPAGAPSHWLAYFTAANVDETHAKAQRIGARSFVPPTDVGGGPRFAVLADPQGAMFALMSEM